MLFFGGSTKYPRQTMADRLGQVEKWTLEYVQSTFGPIAGVAINLRSCAGRLNCPNMA